MNELETELRKMECGDVVVAEASGSSYERVPGGWPMDGAVFVPGGRVVAAVTRGAPLVDKVLAYVTQAGKYGASNRDLTIGCKPYRSASKEERKAVMAQLVKNGLIEPAQRKGLQGKRWAVTAAGEAVGA